VAASPPVFPVATLRHADPITHLAILRECTWPSSKPVSFGPLPNFSSPTPRLLYVLNHLTALRPKQSPHSDASPSRPLRAFCSARIGSRCSTFFYFAAPFSPPPPLSPRFPTVFPSFFTGHHRSPFTDGSYVNVANSFSLKPGLVRLIVLECFFFNITYLKVLEF